MPKVYIPSIPRRGKRDSSGKLIIDPETDRPIFEPFIDFSVAAVYGELVEEPVFGYHGVVFAAMQDNVSQVRRHLRDFDPDEDSIIAVGDPVAIALCCSVAVRDFNGYSILRWDGKTRQYIKMSFKI
jgi:hypothetical protein